MGDGIKMMLAEAAIKYYISQTLEKLNIHDRKAVSTAMEQGLME